MSSKPKISVIMAVYNGMPYLKQAVESILSQTYKNFEFIIVDDGSKDNTWQYLKSLKDKQSLRSSAKAAIIKQSLRSSPKAAGLKRIKLIRNKKNLGLAVSLNKALLTVSGDFIARMDSDDISLPTRFKTQIEFLLDHPQIDICGSWADLIDKDSKIIGEKKYPVKDQDIKKALNWYSAIIHPTFMARIFFYTHLKGYNPKFDLAEDYELLLRAKSKFKMANIPQKLLLWRLWGKRRSRQDMERMDRTDLQIKIEAFKRGDFPPLYAATLIKKLVMTYLLPFPIKLKLAKMLKLA